MFEYFVGPHVCLSVSPCKHKKNFTCVDGAFYFRLGFWVAGFSLDLSFGGWVKFIFKIKCFFLGGGGGFLGGCFYFEFLGAYFVLRGFFFLFCGGGF